jgi:phosphopentomutase
MLVGDLQVGRVIARPFVERDGEYIRTSDRKDYAVSPTGRTLLDFVKDSGKTVYAIGKISDIFNGQGISISVHTDSNEDGINKTIEAIRQDFGGLVFTNLVEFDSLYGHRRDGFGYGMALEYFDKRLPEIMDAMKDEDMLILCADHGNDPTYSGWDHTREHTPALIYGKNIKSGVDLGTRKSFGDYAATAAGYLGTEAPAIGHSFLDKILK